AAAACVQAVFRGPSPTSVSVPGRLRRLEALMRHSGSFNFLNQPTLTRDMPLSPCDFSIGRGVSKNMSGTALYIRDVLNPFRLTSVTPALEHDIFKCWNFLRQ